MEKKPRIVFYNDLNGPHEDQIRKNASLTPEERWAVYLRMKRRHTGLFGKPDKRVKRITVERPIWM